jgi:hypothetical protein
MTGALENKLSPYSFTKGAYALNETNNTRAVIHRKVMNKLMIACCVPMIVGGAIVFFSIPEGQSPSTKLAALAPIAGCFMMHIIMHKFMDRACCSNVKKEEK